MKKLLLILTLLYSIQGIAQIQGYLKLNGNTNDASGYGNDATNSGAVSNAGFMNGGYMTDTNTDVISFNNSSYFNWERTQPFTVSMMVKFGTIANGTYHMLYNKVYRDGTGYWRGIDIKGYSNGSGIEFIFDMQSNTMTNNYIEVYTSYLTLTVGKWYNLVFTYAGNSLASGITINVNGVKYSQSVYKDALSATIISTSTAKLGNSTTPNNTYASPNAVYDEFKIDASVWPVSRIKNEYSKIKGTF